MNIKRPNYRSIPARACREVQSGLDLIFEEKMDGAWCVLPSGVVGEKMANGDFYAFDLINDETFNLPLRERLHVLAKWYPSYNRPFSYCDGSCIDIVFEHGGEGMVIKHLDGLWGDEWVRCKRFETFDLIVSEKHTGGKSSIRLSDSGIDRGWCPCRSAFDKVRVGDVVEVAAYGLTGNGKLREPRFVRPRPDKTYAP